MTSEYDELLARLDAAAARSTLTTLASETAAAIRALTAQVVERDAVIEQIAEWEQNPGSTYGELGHLLVTHFHAQKDQSGDALAARDAVRDKTVRATAWDEGFNAGEADVFQHDESGWAHDDACIQNPYRARADQKESKS